MKKYGKEMEEAYNKLPKTFGNIPPRQVTNRGENRVGVLNVRTFYRRISRKTII